MDIEIVKVHGSENDFFILDERTLSTQVTEEQWKLLAMKLTSRQNGLLKGADGLLIVGESQRQGTAGKLRILNADGSEAKMCGNGLRTVGRYIAEKTGQTAFLVETKQADLQVKMVPELWPQVATVQVEISPVLFETKKLPFFSPQSINPFIQEKLPQLDDTLLFSAVAVPNPHLIAFTNHETILGPKLEKIAAYLNGENPFFPKGVNVSFAEVLADHKLFVRTYERGVGFTNACGTAMAATSLIYTLVGKGRREESITVWNPGGVVQTIVHQKKDGTYWMELIGNATFIARINLSEENLFSYQFEEAVVHSYQEEKAYQLSVESIRKLELV